MKCRIVVTLEDDTTVNLNILGPGDQPVLYLGLLDYAKELVLRKDRLPKQKVQLPDPSQPLPPIPIPGH